MASCAGSFRASLLVISIQWLGASEPAVYEGERDRRGGGGGEGVSGGSFSSVPKPINEENSRFSLAGFLLVSR